jgi:hypothetical protein
MFFIIFLGKEKALISYPYNNLSIHGEYYGDWCCRTDRFGAGG